MQDISLQRHENHYSKFKEKPTSEDEKKLSYVYDKYVYTFEFDEQKNITKVNFDIMETKIKYSKKRSKAQVPYFFSSFKN
ncbi:hypothetical protein [Clostridium frigidicarnis]|uniref:hypothetical protein n=1 Tax=Clostridium frigidicarnis TaxID=84698 RepID=UPI001160AD00|nr:hypothetical protein [Clostridium frigidicarnis]